MGIFYDPTVTKRILFEQTNKMSLMMRKTLTTATRATLNRSFTASSAVNKADFKTVGIVGFGGLMGHGVAQVTAAAGYNVIGIEGQQAGADAGMKRIEASLNKVMSGKVKKGLLDEDNAKKQYNDIISGIKEYDSAEKQSEEIINLSIDAINLGVLKQNDVGFLQKLANNFKSAIGTILGKQEAENYNINTAEDAWSMVNTFSKDVLTKTPVEIIGTDKPEENLADPEVGST